MWSTILFKFIGNWIFEQLWWQKILIIDRCNWKEENFVSFDQIWGSRRIDVTVILPAFLSDQNEEIGIAPAAPLWLIDIGDQR